MKVFIVATVSGSMVGIEKCRAFMVSPAQEAAFVREYAGRILWRLEEVALLLPIPLTIYKGL